MDMDEHLEELEDDFGSETNLSTAAVKNEPVSHKPDSSTAAPIKMSWLNANGIVPPVLPKRSRWGPDEANIKTQNIIKTVTEKYYGKAAPMRSRKHLQPTPVQPMIPPPGFFPPPIFMRGMPPIPPGMPFSPIMAGQIAPTSQHSTSPRRRSRSRSPAHRRSRSPRRRSSDLADGISTSDMTAEERRKFEENKIFVKLLLTKLLVIRSNRRLESLHVNLMTMVKKAVDEEEGEQSLSSYRRSR